MSTRVLCKPKNREAQKKSHSVLLCVVCLVLLFTPGCFLVRTVRVGTPWPIIDVPERPELEGDDFNDRELALFGHVLQVEGRVKRYNEKAKEHNLANGD